MQHLIKPPHHVVNFVILMTLMSNFFIVTILIYGNIEVITAKQVPPKLVNYRACCVRSLQWSFLYISNVADMAHLVMKLCYKSTELKCYYYPIY